MPYNAWVVIPDGAAFVSYTQQLQYTWQMTDDQGGQHSFTVSLPSLNWSWIKVDKNNWEVQ